MAEAPPSPQRLPLALGAVVDLHTSVATAAAAAAALMNENSSASTAGGAAGGGVDLQCPATPHHKMPELFTSSSDSEPEEQSASQQLEASANAASSSNAADAARAASPPPNCAICLGRCKNKCFTDSCMHQFCFKCLCEWSKVKPECPLCKQTFKSIIHNVKSIDQFEEYHVQPPTVQIPHRPIEVTAYNQAHYIVDGLVVNSRNDYEISVRNWDGPRADHRIVRAGRTILYPSTFTGGASGSGASGSGASVGIVHRGELLDMYRQEYPDAVASSTTLSQLWRRYVYDRKLYALPVCDITGRFRDSSARFYRDNPAQIHRLMPWINRDISCLLRNTEHSVTSVLETINEGLTLLNVLSPGFRRRLQPFLGTKTTHFIHELNNFARSPYDMIGYDRTVQYSPQTAEEIVIEFSSSSSGEDAEEDEAPAANANVDANNAVAERRVRRRQPVAAAAFPTQQMPAARNLSEYRVQSRAVASAAAVASNTSSSTSAQQPQMMNLLSFTISTTSEGTEAPGLTVAVSGGRGAQSTAINLTTHNRTATAAAAAAAVANNDIIIDLDDNDGDLEVEVELASPGGENLNVSNASNASNTSHGFSHLMRALEDARRELQITENIELTSSSSNDCEFVLERKAPHLRTPEMVSLNSDSDSDVVFVDESKSLNTATSSGATATAVAPSATGWDSGDDNDEAISKTIDANLRATGSAATAIKNELDNMYNAGPSTSAGLRSTGRKRRQKSIDAEKMNMRREQRRPRAMCVSKNEGEGLPQSQRLRSRGKRIGSESSFDSSEEESLRPAARERPTFSYTEDSDEDDRDDDEDYVDNKRTTVKARGSQEAKRITRTTRRQARKSGGTPSKAGNKRVHSKTNPRPYLIKRSKLSAATTHANELASDDSDSDEKLDESFSLNELKKQMAAQRQRTAAERKSKAKNRKTRKQKEAEDAETKAKPPSSNNTSSSDSSSSSGDEGIIAKQEYDPHRKSPAAAAAAASSANSESEASSDRHNASSRSSVSAGRRTHSPHAAHSSDELLVTNINATPSATARATIAGRDTPNSTTSSSSSSASSMPSASHTHSHSHSHSNSNSNSNSTESSPRRSPVAITSAGEDSGSVGTNSDSNFNMQNSSYTLEHHDADAAQAPWPPEEEEEEEEEPQAEADADAEADVEPEDEPEEAFAANAAAAAVCSNTSSSSSPSWLAATNEAAAALAEFANSATRHHNTSASFSGVIGSAQAARSYEMSAYSDPEASYHSSADDL